MDRETSDTNESFADVTGVILAGGRSRRMGRDKAQLTIAGQTPFARMLAVFRQIFPRILIAGDRPDLARPDVPAIPDEFPGSALGGLYTGLLAATTPFIFAAACDMPFPDAALVRALVRRRQGWDAVVPCPPAGPEPLFAVYGKKCLEPMRELLGKKRFRIIDIFPRIRLRLVLPEEMPPGWERALINVNTPEELCRLQEKAP